MANEVAKTGGGGAVVKSDKTIAGMLAKPETAWGRELLKVLPGKKEVARFMACALNQLADPKVYVDAARVADLGREQANLRAKLETAEADLLALYEA